MKTPTKSKKSSTVKQETNPPEEKVQALITGKKVKVTFEGLEFEAHRDRDGLVIMAPALPAMVPGYWGQEILGPLTGLEVVVRGMITLGQDQSCAFMRLRVYCYTTDARHSKVRAKPDVRYLRYLFTQMPETKRATTCYVTPADGSVPEILAALEKVGFQIATTTPSKHGAYSVTLLVRQHTFPDKKKKKLTKNVKTTPDETAALP